jgi:hypothetical protein
MKHTFNGWDQYGTPVESFSIEVPPPTWWGNVRAVIMWWWPRRWWNLAHRIGLTSFRWITTIAVKNEEG